MNPTQATVLELRDAVADKSVSATELVQAFTERIGQHNSRLNAYRESLTDHALARAKQVDSGDITGPLAGVPIAIKDCLCHTQGTTACSSRMLEHYHSPFTGTAVQRLEDAGAIVLGKTVMDEFAMGSSTEHSAFGPVRNPWGSDYVPGGSSGGSAAAVAAGFAAASLGSDTGGSIRQPAALCGVVGFKPTYGRVSRWGLVAFASSLDQIGPFTRTAEDAALITQVMAGHDPLDSTSAQDAVPDLLAACRQERQEGGPMRIGIARQYLSDRNHPAQAAAIDAAVKVYEQAGAELIEVDLPHTEYGVPVYYVVATAEASSNLARYDGVRYGRRAQGVKDIIELVSQSRSEGFGPEVQRRIMLGTYALSSGYYDAYYLRALKVRRLIKQDFDRAFEHCDAILCPTTPGPAFRFGDKTDDPLEMYLNDIYTVNANLAGLPGISLPGGFTEPTDDAPAGLPLGVQLLGPLFSEGPLLRLARLYQQATDHHTRHPVLGGGQ